VFPKTVVQTCIVHMIRNSARFFAFPIEVRRILYTTNAIESLDFQLRKIIRSKVTSPVTKPPPNCSSLPCATLRKNGSCLKERGIVQ
jgi:transposase-like protein